MSRCQTFPRLEKRPGAFCFFRSEKRPANRTGSSKVTDPRTGNLSSGVPVRCFLSVPSWYVEPSLGIPVCPIVVLRSWLWQLRMLIGATTLLSFPWQSFAVVDVEPMMHSLMRWARSKRTPSLVQKHQQCASERQVTQGADRGPSMGHKLQTVGGLALLVCACVSLVFCSLVSVPPAFVVRVCSCGCLLRCLAVLPLSLCPLAFSPQFLHV